MKKKVLCVYDPSLIFIPYEHGASVHDAITALDEHHVAQTFFGFKIALSQMVELALETVNITTLASSDILTLIRQRLLNLPNSYFPVSDTPNVSFRIQQGESLFASYIDQEIAEFWQNPIGSCFDETDSRVCYASWRQENESDELPSYTDQADRQLDVAYSRYDWGEVYRRTRKNPAHLLPNTFTPTPEGKVVFAFCPPEGFLEDEADLTRQALPRNMVESRKWHGVNGYKDRWGNFWVFNPNRGHWDVQITERTKQITCARDHHLNVERGGRRAPSDDTSLEGCIEEGHRPDPEVMRRHFSIWTKE